MITKGLEYWNKRLYFLGGASLTLLLVALADLPQRRQSPFNVVDIDGWFGIWLVLLVMNLVSGLVLLLFSRWREIPLQQRLLPVVAYFGLVWLVLLALSMRLTTHLPVGFHYTVFGLGILLAIVASFIHWKTHRIEALFP